MNNRKVSIAAVLSVTLVSMVTALLGAFAFVSYVSERDQGWARLRDTLSASADQQATAIATPLKHADASHIMDVIRSGMRPREIASIAAFTEGKTYIQSRDAAWQVTVASAQPSATGLLVEERNIIHKGQSIGLLRVMGSPKFLEKELSVRRHSMVAFILVLDATLLLSLYLLLRHWILRPVKTLERFAASVGATGSTGALPARRLFEGELATLRDSIQDMITLLDRRHSKLRESEERLKRSLAEQRRAADDISALNARLENRVHERTAQLEAAMNLLTHAREDAESAMRARNQFLANMSQEIRSPMNAVLVMTDLALRCEMPAKPRGYLTRARAAADSLLLSINDILDLSKIESGRLDKEARAFALQGVLDRVTAVIGMKAHEKGIELLLNTSSDLPPLLNGDALRLEQVLINLCNNAVKFTAHGEIVVTTVKSMVTGDKYITLCFSVRDTGMGMTQQQVRGLFQPINSLDAPTTKRHGESTLGLGLTICKELVSLMGGEIGVNSRPGRGSDFYFTAVFGLVDEATVALEPPPGLRNLHILVVDDSPNSRDIFQSLLRGLGYRPTMASSAADGLAELERSAIDKPYDLVLLDWKLPEMDGFEFADQVRHSARLAPLKIVMVTAYGDTALLRRLAAEKLDGCLTKPVSINALMESITGAFGAEVLVPAIPRRVPQLEQDAMPASLRGRHVLLVEDSEFNRIIATEVLADMAGMVVSLATNGEEALRRIHEEHFDVVLMDIQMPVMDGYEATALIRQESAYRDLPIIAMTTHSLARDRDKCLAVGMNDHVAKPFDPVVLFTILVKWIAVDRSGADKPVVDAQGGRGPRRAQQAVSFELGLQRCLGRQELYERILGRFLATRQSDTDDIRSALERHDLEGTAAIAHSIISRASTIGAEALSDAARALQLAIDAGEVDRLPGLVDTFAQRHAGVIDELKAYFEHQRSA